MSRLTNGTEQEPAPLLRKQSPCRSSGVTQAFSPECRTSLTVSNRHRRGVALASMIWIVCARRGRHSARLSTLVVLGLAYILQATSPQRLPMADSSQSPFHTYPVRYEHDEAPEERGLKI